MGGRQSSASATNTATDAHAGRRGRRTAGTPAPTDAAIGGGDAAGGTRCSGVGKLRSGPDGVRAAIRRHSPLPVGRGRQLGPPRRVAVVLLNLGKVRERGG